MAAFDFKKEYRDLYAPKTTPCVMDVPQMTFIMLDGRGDPNVSPAYEAALEVLYGLSYTIRMSRELNGGFAYVVPPLEGFWQIDDGGAFTGGGPVPDKNKFAWTALIRQPDFVTRDIFEAAKTALSKKKPQLDLSSARMEPFTEGLCVQALHLGPYDDEPATIAAIERFLSESRYVSDLSGTRRHHEIYLGDPRRTAPENLKTVIRHPIRIKE